MKIFRNLASLLLLSVLVLSSQAFAVQRLFGTNPYTNTAGLGTAGLVELNPTTGAVIASRVITLVGRGIDGATALARDPTTGITYAALKVTGLIPRLLATIDLDTGVATEIGSLGDKFSSLAFRADGQLFGDTGNGAAVRKTLYTINKATGAATFARTLGVGADGEIIVYNPVDTNFYHFTGNGTVVFEKFPSVAPYTPIVPIAPALGTGEIFGAVWDPVRNAFLASDISSRLRVITPAGVVTDTIPGLPNDMRGLVLFDDAPAAPTVVPVFAPIGLALLILGMLAIGRRRMHGKFW